jgi:hypothetical protein
MEQTKYNLYIHTKYGDKGPVPTEMMTPSQLDKRCRDACVNGILITSNAAGTKYEYISPNVIETIIAKQDPQ